MRRSDNLFILFLLLTTLTGCAFFGHGADPAITPKPLVYEIDLNNRADDLFKVRLLVDDLSAGNAIYQFAATAPGTYQVMDIGRYVREFQALDSAGQPLPVTRLNTNQWQISEPERVSEIHYAVAETWDTPVDSNQIFPMAGTSIEDDHVQLNGHCVFGYPAGMQARPLKIKLHYPETWQLGTALVRGEDGYFRADNYDHIVDSPFLLGRLSRAELKVNSSKVEIYTYSKTDKVKANQILDSVRDILVASADFMDGLPVKRYTFLFHFEDATFGAWEHSYSSTYAYSEANFEQLLQQNIPAVVAHEFYHIVTPLNIHSEIIEQFNFVEPVPSQHLWLYEGVTEWAAHIMQLRAGLIDLETYLQVLRQKLNVNDSFRQDFSLRDLALKSYTPEGQQQYGNIYMRGAIVAGLLDILLLERSNGKRGLRELINELARTYGPDRAFSETGFFDELVRRTYPEVRDFLEAYVNQANPLPIESYYGKLGIAYQPKVHTGEQEATAGFSVMITGGRIALANLSPAVQEYGLQDGDIITGYNGQEVELRNAQQVFSGFRQLEAGVPYELRVERDGQSLTFKCEKIMRERIESHVFNLRADVSQEQLKLRQAWMKNL